MAQSTGGATGGGGSKGHYSIGKTTTFNYKKEVQTKVSLLNGKKRIVFPITPESFEVTDTWQNEELNINKLGVITMIGKRGLKSITISSFLPKQSYTFIRKGATTYGTAKTAAQKESLADKKLKGYRDPWGVIRMIQSWRGKVLTLFISNTEKRVSWPCVIDGDFTYGERDGTGDVYFSLTLKEYKKTKSKRSVKRPIKATLDSFESGTLATPDYYETKKGDTINKVCRKFFGDTKKKKTVYKRNKKAITKAFKRYMKKMSKKEQQKYKKKSKYNRVLPKKTMLMINSRKIEFVGGFENESNMATGEL